MPKRVELTKSNENALRVLAALESPSLQDWADGLGFSVTAVQFHKQVLTRKGLIEITAGKARSTRLTDAGRRYLKKVGK